MSLTFVENQALKTYYQYYTEFLSAEGKLKEATRLEEKQKQSASKKMGRLIEKVSLPFKYQKMPFNFILNDYIILYLILVITKNNIIVFSFVMHMGSIFLLCIVKCSKVALHMTVTS